MAITTGQRETVAHHPSGHTKVRDVMSVTICSADSADTIDHVANLMRDHDCGFIPITSDDIVVGVITDRDIVLRGVGFGAAAPPRVWEVMSSEVTTIDADQPLDQAAKLMASRQVRRLPVLAGGKLVGVLSHGDLVQALQGRGTAIDATVGVTRKRAEST